MLQNIENKYFFVNSWAYFQENTGHFDIIPYLSEKLKGNGKYFDMKRNFFYQIAHFNVGHPVYKFSF